LIKIKFEFDLHVM